MDTVDVLKRTWQTLWRYRALWIFGVVLALTTTSWSSWSLLKRLNDREDGRDRISIQMDRPRGYTIRIWGENDPIGTPERLQIQVDPRYGITVRELDNDLRTLKLVPADILRIALTLLAVLFGTILILIVVGKIARYVSETSLLRMVSEYDETGARHSVGQGLRRGWSLAALRLFLIDLLVDIPAVLAFIVLFVLVLTPLFLWATGSQAAGFAGTVMAGGLFFLVVALAILVGALLGLLKRFFWRACALNNLGVFASIRQGFGVLRAHFTEVLPIWLVTLGTRLAWPMVIVPLVFVLLAAGTVAGGVTGLALGGLTRLFTSGAPPVMVGIFSGSFIFLMVLITPLVLLGGMLEVFLSSTWTLTYRDLGGMELPEAQPLPRLAPSTA